MKDFEFHKNEFYENYIFGRLKEEDEALFEEHMLHCDECRQNLAAMEKIVEVVQNTNNTKLSKEKLRIPGRRITWYSVAAGFLIFISIGVILKKDTQNNPEKFAEKVHSKSDSTVVDSITMPKENIQESSNNREKLSENPLLAKAYETNPLFENAINNQLRSNDIQVVRPENKVEISRNQNLNFTWQGKFANLNLVIFDNRSDIVFEEEIKNGYIFDTHLDPGLYYWQLETSEESLITQKFIVKSEKD